MAMTEYNIPKSKFEVVKNIMIGWYRAGADDETISNGDVERYTSISKSTISRQNKFLTQLGILEKEGQNRKLTDTGKEITRELANGREDDAREKMRPLLEKFDITDQLHSVVEMTGPLSEEEMVSEVGSITGHDPEGRDKTGLKSLVNLYEWAGYFEEQDGNYKAVNRGEIEEPSVDTTPDEGEEKTEKSSIENQDSDFGASTVQQNISTPAIAEGVNITLEISAEQSPKDVKNKIIAIREAFEHDISVGDDDSEGSDEASPTILSDFENGEAEDE